MAKISETEHARFTRVSQHVLEIRLHPGLRIDGASVAAIMHERMRSAGSVPLCVLVLVPPDADLDLTVIGMDHYRVNTSAAGLRAVAIVTETLMLETVARLYVAYFPPLFRLEVFITEADAREWPNEPLTELSQAGQNA